MTTCVERSFRGNGRRTIVPLPTGADTGFPSEERFTQQAPFADRRREPARSIERMYLPGHFTEERIEILAELVRRHPFATLVSLDGDGLIATHLPLLWDADRAPYGTLRGHFARPSPHAKVASSPVDALAIFAGPNAYVSPSWLPSKEEHGKVLPTWNYAAVHAYGPLRLVDDTEWLRALITRLTDRHEATSTKPWRVSDAPETFIDAMLRGIVGVEIEITRLEGKWKLGQNRPEADQAGVVAGLAERGDPGSAALADLTRAHRASRDRR